MIIVALSQQTVTEALHKIKLGALSISSQETMHQTVWSSADG